jgi:hypothetical protein
MPAILLAGAVEPQIACAHPIWYSRIEKEQLWQLQHKQSFPVHLANTSTTLKCLLMRVSSSLNARVAEQ